MRKASNIQVNLDFDDLLEQIREIVHTELQQIVQSEYRQQQENKGPSAYLRSKEAAAVVGVSQTTFSTWVREGKMPAGYKLSEGVVVWPDDEILAAVKLIGKREPRTAVAV